MTDSQPLDINGRVLTVGCHVVVVCTCGKCGNAPSIVAELSRPDDVLPPIVLAFLSSQGGLEPGTWLVRLEGVDAYVNTRSVRRVDDHEPAGSWQDVMDSLTHPTKVH